jgi:hypothetical protein
MQALINQGANLKLQNHCNLAPLFREVLIYGHSGSHNGEYKGLNGVCSSKADVCVGIAL